MNFNPRKKFFSDVLSQLQNDVKSISPPHWVYTPNRLTDKMEHKRRYDSGGKNTFNFTHKFTHLHIQSPIFCVLNISCLLNTDIPFMVREYSFFANFNLVDPVQWLIAIVNIIWLWKFIEQSGDIFVNIFFCWNWEGIKKSYILLMYELWYIIIMRSEKCDSIERIK